jgi:hypothetical protein
MHLKVFLKLKKTLKPSLLGKKTQKKQKTQKSPKKPTGLVFFKNPGFFPTLTDLVEKYFTFSSSLQIAIFTSWILSSRRSIKPLQEERPALQSKDILFCLACGLFFLPCVLCPLTHSNPDRKYWF